MQTWEDSATNVNKRHFYHYNEVQNMTYDTNHNARGNRTGVESHFCRAVN